MMEKAQQGRPDIPDELLGASNRLRLALKTDPQGVLATLAGELDLATAPELDQRLDEIAENEHGRVLIDLRDLEFMDSTGLASIVRAQQSADSSGRRLALRLGSGQVHRLFELTGMLERLTFED